MPLARCAAEIGVLPWPALTCLPPSPLCSFDLASETWDCPRCCGPDSPAAQPACSHAAAVPLPPRSVCAVATHGCASCSHGNHIVVFGGEVDPSSECLRGCTIVGLSSCGQCG